VSTRKTRRLQDEIRRLELIVSTTLALGREQQLQLDRQDLNLLVREVAELIAPQLEHRDIELETRLEALPETALDGDKAKQILFNLITNSVDALPEGGHILVHTRHDPAHHRLELQVEDSGTGIAPELQRKLFTQSVNVKESGLGVGLMLCRELVELHGGTITVDTSTTLGGAKFTVRFPIIARL
jgi:signal transduction histidine kinase